MTRNQIEWYKARTGRMELEESARHNRVGEAIAMNNYELGVRSQGEVERHNLVVERQSDASISVARQQAAASMLGAQASMAGAAAAMVNAQAAKLNAETNEKLLPYQQASEVQKGAMYAAQASKYTTEAIGQRIENVHAGDVRASELAVNESKQKANEAQASYYDIMAQERPRENDIREAGNWMDFSSSMFDSTMDTITDVYRTGMNSYSYGQ